MQPAQRRRAPVYNEEATIERVLRARVHRARRAPVRARARRRRLQRRLATPRAAQAGVQRSRASRVVQLSRNFGHQTALTAGLDHARGDAVVMLDADLQDPPELIPTMLDHWRAGCDVVYAVREQRDGESRFKLATARWFYALFDWLAQVELAAQLGRLPAARPPGARRAAVDARAQPLPARDDRVGRLHAGGGPIQARRRATRARRSTRSPRC